MIQFLRSSRWNSSAIMNHLMVSQEARIWTNNGPNERKLQRMIEEIVGAHVVCTANATVAIEVLHRMFWAEKMTQAFLPMFTFPATNISVPKEQRRWVEPIVIACDRIGHTKRKIYQKNSYQVITIPFGDNARQVPYLPDKMMPCFVDAAAAATPTMAVVRHWLQWQKAHAVVVSLHATKLWPAGEGGFVAFRDKSWAEEFRALINFGIEGVGAARACTRENGTNGKMSELAAAAAIANFPLFVEDYQRRSAFANSLAEIARERHIGCIESAQSFWFFSPLGAQETAQWFFDRNVEARPYYWASHCTPRTACSDHGVCLPVWCDSQKDKMLIAELLKEFLDENAHLSIG